MRIAFDLDGVLADLHAPFVQAAVQLFPELDRTAIRAQDIGASPPDSDDAAALAGEAPEATEDVPMSSSQTAAVWRHLGGVPDFWEGLKEIEPGAIARLARVAEQRRWEVLFITSRPRSAGRTVQRQSQRWLERCGFPLPSLYVVHGSRGQIAAALQLDIVVDDRPDNCLDVVLESRAGAILVWRGNQAAVPASARRLGIAVAGTVAESLDAIVEAETLDTDGTFLDRLRRLFGLKTRAASPLRR